MDYSVLIVGGGPAGSLAAWRLASAGVDVLVVERERPRRVAAAEILSPEGRGILEAENLWHDMPLALTWPCPGIATAWEGPDPTWALFGATHNECAWHVDRAGFDAWMSARIRTAGALVETGTVEAVQRDDDGWRVAFRARDRYQSTSARCLVLATGRSAAAIRLAPRHRIDNLCLVAGTTTADPVDPDVLVVEAAADGWWYSAPLIDKRLFTGWMTDFSLVGHRRYEEAALASLERAPVHARRIGEVRLTTTIGSATWAMSPSAGPGWIAIGDAALARDPISGDGLTSALRSACEGAEVVVRSLAGDRSVWASAAEHGAEIARRYRDRRLNLYRIAQKRWPEAAFWRRF